ncbi:hypothetical protein Tco_0213563 [Tanacetum coccineum]
MQLMFIRDDTVSPKQNGMILMDANQKVDLDNMCKCPPQKQNTRRNIIKTSSISIRIALLLSYHGSIWHTGKRMQDIYQNAGTTRYHWMGFSTAIAVKVSRKFHDGARDRRSTRLTPPALVPTIDKADEMILQDTLQQKGEGRKGKIIEKSRSTPFSSTPLEDPSSNWSNSIPTIVDTHIKEQVKKQVPKQAKISSQIQNIDNHIPSQVDASSQQQDIAIWLAHQMKFESLQVPQTTCRTSSVRLRDQDDPHDDAHPEGERSCFNPHAKILLHKELKEPGENQSKVIYSNSRSFKVSRRMGTRYLIMRKQGCYWSLSVFIRSLVIWERVHDFQLGIESYQQKVNLTAPTIYFPGVEKHKMFSIIYELVHGIIYKNSKKEKRVMIHSEIHKFCDATLNRVLEGLRSYNNDVKYGYIQRDLTNDKVEYLKLFEEEIEVRLKYRNQMRRWE